MRPSFFDKIMPSFAAAVGAWAFFPDPKPVLGAICVGMVVFGLLMWVEELLR